MKVRTKLNSTIEIPNGYYSYYAIEERTVTLVYDDDREYRGIAEIDFEELENYDDVISVTCDEIPPTIDECCKNCQDNLYTF